MPNTAESKSIFINSTIIVCAVSLVAVGAQIRHRVDLSGDGPHPSFMVSRDNHPEVTVSDTYKEVTQLLKQEYVEPVTSDMKLSSGAIRGMMASLGDPESPFLDKDEFRVLRGQQSGVYEGIGAELALILPSRKMIKPGATSGTPGEEPADALATTSRIPELTVVALTPDGAAAKAGVRVGDVVDSVEGHWVVNSDLIDEFNQARRQFTLKKIGVSEINAIRKKLRAQTEHAMLPLKARQKLWMGTDGRLSVRWKRGAKRFDTELHKSRSQLRPFSVAGNQVVLPFTTGAASLLQEHVKGKSSLTIDLRNNPNGDFGEMKRCLAVLARSGNYGFVKTQKKEKAVPVVISKGNPNPPKLTLLVDASTRGAAEIFALALSKFAGATLSGASTGHERSVLETVPLPDGSGYCLVTGEYVVSTGATK